MSDQSARGSCAVCQREFRKDRLFPAAMVRSAVADRIKAVCPRWDEQSLICRDDLTRFRTEYVQSLLASENRELTDLETEVVESMRQHEVLASNPDEEY